MKSKDLLNWFKKLNPTGVSPRWGSPAIALPLLLFIVLALIVLASAIIIIVIIVIMVTVIMIRMRLSPHNVAESSRVEMMAECPIDHPFFVKDKGKKLFR